VITSLEFSQVRTCLHLFSCLISVSSISLPQPQSQYFLSSINHIWSQIPTLGLTSQKYSKIQPNLKVFLKDWMYPRFGANIHLSVNTYYVSFFVNVLPHSGWCPPGQHFQQVIFNKGSACSRMRIDPFLSSYTNLKCKWIKDLNIKPDRLKLIEEKGGRA
jgi:hypothetical protein